ncbi:fluoride efflux transporter FluC [Nocardia stercoris]|uniref:Fluoride-specific ion channel FluC n=1 Tax=Nocardia stercoris TaxID=2483361 RepID=A0A3M2LCU3_9NOCA|nr:CrcB family protein [Nocardia stercoris]RMI35302.1 CrcB family protein [Nocardia stercoris]
MTAVLVIVGAMIGAPTRYLVDRGVAARWDTLFPFGTFVVNIAGSAILGAVIGASAGHLTYALLGTGFCGALTTFSTFGYETVRLAEARAYRYALANIVVGVSAGLAAAYAGAVLAQWMWS